MGCKIEYANSIFTVNITIPKTQKTLKLHNNMITMGPNMLELWVTYFSFELFWIF